MRNFIKREDEGRGRNLGFSSKGQSSILSRPVILVLMISVMLILVYTIYSSGGTERQKERELDLRTVGTNTLLILANSEQCLAYRVPVIYGGYANVVDVKKLEQFAANYKNIEPLCARSFDFGWRVKVNEIDRQGIARTWSFGSKAFSKRASLRQAIITNMPIAVRYSNYDIRPAKLEIEVVDGELEQLSGFLDSVCYFKKSSGVNVILSYSAYLENNELCMGTGQDKTCKVLLCKVNMDSLSSGSHYLNGNYNNEVVNIVT